jgi:hypothetical protein
LEKIFVLGRGMSASVILPSKDRFTREFGFYIYARFDCALGSAQREGIKGFNIL